MTLGLVIGKFYPPHRGHKHLIDSARSQCDHLVVILAHHPSQQIPGELRLAWLREIHPDCDVRLVPDELDDDSAQWARWTIDYLGRAPDVVFTSEDYGPAYASLMGARHVMVDRGRQAVPTSGTAVRNDPLAALDFLEPVVRAHFVRRVVLIGAESTGKTTLARELAEHFSTAWVPEYGREYWEQKAKGWETATPNWTSEEFAHIAAEQQRREDLAARSANRVLICDTNAFATGTWHERYLGSRSDAVDAIGRRDRSDLYLLADVDAPFVQDGWRDGENVRQWMHERFVAQMKEAGARFQVLSGDWNARRAAAIRAIEALLQVPIELSRPTQ
jgi:NadR type nicotinamide-nucleotide adenylyltransferase